MACTSRCAVTVALIFALVCVMSCRALRRLPAVPVVQVQVQLEATRMPLQVARRRRVVTVTTQVDRKLSVPSSLFRLGISSEINVIDGDGDDDERSVGNVTSHTSASTGTRTSWYSPKHKKEDIDQWWRDCNKHLLSIGLKGVSQSHINSLGDLLSHHERVRVRVTSDKVDGTAMAAEMLESPVLKDTAEVLHVRSREVLFGKIRNARSKQ